MGVGLGAPAASLPPRCDPDRACVRVGRFLRSCHREKRPLPTWEKLGSMMRKQGQKRVYSHHPTEESVKLNEVAGSMEHSSWNPATLLGSIPFYAAWATLDRECGLFSDSSRVSAGPGFFPNTPGNSRCHEARRYTHTRYRERERERETSSAAPPSPTGGLQLGPGCLHLGSLLNQDLGRCFWTDPSGLPTLNEVSGPKRTQIGRLL